MWGNCDADMRVDHSDVTASTRKWPKKVGDLTNKARKLPCYPPGFLALFILHVIVMWQCLRANQFAPFQECVVHPVFIFCLFFCKWSQKVWSTRFSFNSKNRADHSAFFMPYLSDLLPFMVIFEQTLWRDIITNKFTFSIETEIWNKKSKNYF